MVMQMTDVLRNDRKAYEESVNEQRRRRAAMLTEDHSWLTLAGRYWLKVGINRLGHAPENEIMLPNASTPDFAGVIRLEGNKIEFEAAPGVVFTSEGQSFTRRELHPANPSEADYITLGDLTLTVIQRAGEFFLRVWDKANPARRIFPGLRWYPIRPEYRITAQFVAYEPPRKLPIVNVVGMEFEVGSPGYVCFEWEGKPCRLVAEDAGDQLFFNFGDRTNGDATYGAGRFLYTDLPEDRAVILDFNLATNPYCAYTAYATCPLPFKENRLPVRIEAGEMDYLPA
jgi:uncharacterized protein (DUF1684 family)